MGLGAAAALVVAVIAILLLARPDTGPGTGADGSSPGRAGCQPLVVLSSTEKAAIMTALAADYNATDPHVGADCIDVRISAKASGGAEQALAAGWNTAIDGPAPTVWSPAASTWVELLRTQRTNADKTPLAPADNPSLAATPVVFAMPEPMARALGWPDTPIGWKTLADLAANPAGWAIVGHPEWGAFTLGKTSPYFSTSGLAGTLGEYYASTGTSSDLKTSDVTDPATAATVAGIESAVTHYGDTTLTFLDTAYRLGQQSSVPYVSAVVVEEKSVHDYNAGNPSGADGAGGPPPRTPLVAVQPAEGTLYSDNPYVVLDADWVDDTGRTAAQGFLQFLQSPQGQARFTAAGFRTPDGTPGEPITSDPAHFTAAAPATVLDAPPGATIDAVLGQWKELRKKARIMVVMDVSGSMDEDAGDGKTKLEKASDAVRASLPEFNAADEVGLAIFSTRVPDSGNGTYRVVVPVGPMGVNGPTIEAALASLRPLSGTPLYNTVALADEQAKASLDPERINAIVVLTDGKNDAPASISLDDLLGRIRTTNENRADAVKVFTIGYGADADMGVLRSISEATEASAYDATDPAKIDKVLTSVMSNF